MATSPVLVPRPTSAAPAGATTSHVRSTDETRWPAPGKPQVGSWCRWRPWTATSVPGAALTRFGQAPATWRVSRFRNWTYAGSATLEKGSTPTGTKP